MAATSWDRFQKTLDHEVDWDAPETGGLSTIKEALEEFVRDPSVLADYVIGFTHDEHRFNYYEPHQEYPRLFMDKFLIYMDLEDRYRVRLHRWTPQREHGTKIQEAHDHRWWFTSAILKGAYMETVYDAEHDEARGTAVLTPASKTQYNEGQIHTLRPQVPHSIYNANWDLECITLFVRGKSQYDVNKTYLDDGTYVVRRSRGKQIKDELQRLGQLLCAA
jgi:predicted metal-dependent enzyme (double-stranded beta helix superfamily)